MHYRTVAQLEENVAASNGMGFAVGCAIHARADAARVAGGSVTMGGAPLLSCTKIA